MTQFFLSMHREKKLSHFNTKSWVAGGTKIWPKKLTLGELKFDLKTWVTGGIIIRPGKVSNWRIFESIELSKLSQFDSQCWFNLTLNVEPIWLNVEPIRLSMLSQFDSQCWVNLTQIFSSYPLCRFEFKFRNWLNFLCQNHLIFFCLCISLQS